MRGDGWGCNIRYIYGFWYSPHARGWLNASSALPMKYYALPVCAGIAGKHQAALHHLKSTPRMRGDS